MPLLEDIVSLHELEEFHKSLDNKALDPITVLKVAKSAYSTAKELGLLGPSDTELALNDINQHIGKLYREIEKLHQKIDTVRDELINFILEVEYRNLAADVISMTKSIGNLEATGSEQYFLDAAYLDSETVFVKLLERLGELRNDSKKAPLYMRYLDLLVIHGASRIVIVSGAPSLPVEAKADLLEEIETELAEFCQVGLAQLTAIFKAPKFVKRCSVDTMTDDRGRPMAALEYFGWGVLGSSACNVVKRVLTSSGPIGGIVLARNEAKREKARQAVQKEINRISHEEAFSVWEPNYKPYTALNEL